MGAFVYVRFKLNWSPILLHNLAPMLGDPRSQAGHHSWVA